jgi:hypothetical protein
MRMTPIATLVFSLAVFAAANAGTFSSKAHSSASAIPAPVRPVADNPPPSQGRLARITAYWPGEDFYTNHKRSATGARLRSGFCAVDSRIIPYGSLVTILGVGSYLAMDTGTAVISRKAARESGHNREERSALVIDLYFASRKAGERFSREGPKFAMVAWGPPAPELASD